MGILSQQQLASGLRLTKDGHCVYLQHEGKTVATFSLHVTIAAIQKEAARYLLELLRSAARS